MFKVVEGDRRVIFNICVDQFELASGNGVGNLFKDKASSECLMWYVLLSSNVCLDGLRCSLLWRYG
jgi:hypothetical protein